MRRAGVFGVGSVVGVSSTSISSGPLRPRLAASAGSARRGSGSSRCRDQVARAGSSRSSSVVTARRCRAVILLLGLADASALARRRRLVFPARARQMVASGSSSLRCGGFLAAAVPGLVFSSSVLEIHGGSGNTSASGWDPRDASPRACSAWRSMGIQRSQCRAAVVGEFYGERDKKQGGGGRGAASCRWCCRPTTKRPTSSAWCATAWPTSTASGLDYELLVVNDGSRDRTGEILDRLATELPRAAPAASSAEPRLRRRAAHRLRRRDQALRVLHGRRRPVRHQGARRHPAAGHRRRSHRHRLPHRAPRPVHPPAQRQAVRRLAGAHHAERLRARPELRLQAHSQEGARRRSRSSRPAR